MTDTLFPLELGTVIRTNKAKNTLRWAHYHFTNSDNKLQLIFKAIQECEFIADTHEWCPASIDTAQELNIFVRRNDVERCLWAYLDFFVLHWESSTRSEIASCQTVCQVCVKAGEVDRETVPVVERMKRLLDSSVVTAIFKSMSSEKARKDAELLIEAFSREERKLLSTGTEDMEDEDEEQEHEQEIDDSSSVTPAIVVSFAGLKSNTHTHTHKHTHTHLNTNSTHPISGFGFAALGSQKKRTEKEKPPEKKPPSAKNVSPTPTSAPVVQEKKHLFRSLSHMIRFDVNLKHQTPVSSGELRFIEQLYKHDTSDKKWVQAVDETKIKVFKKTSEDSPIVLVKAYANIMDVPLRVVMFHIRDITLRVKWDTTFLEYKIVEKDVNGCEMIFCMMKAPFPLSNRDFLQWRRTEYDPKKNHFKMMLRSASHPEYPNQHGFIRAETLISGYIVEAHPDDPNSTQVFIIAQTDVKGMIPKWLVNSFASKAIVEWTDNLRNQCLSFMKKEDIRKIRNSQLGIRS